MITELKFIPGIWKKMPSEMHARRFLERLIWPTGCYCPHCGSTASAALRGRTCRPGLYQCRDCRLQFSITTKTPMHATKLDLRLWVCALFLVLTSSKGISSVVMPRLLGVNQKTGWKLGHAIREMMDDRDNEYLPLSGDVELDEAFIGRAPKSLQREPIEENRISEKCLVFVAASRDGQARATIVENRQSETLGAPLSEWADP